LRYIWYYVFFMATQVTPLQLFVARVPSPLGALRLIWDEDARVRALDFDDFEPRMHHLLDTHYGSERPRLIDAPAPADVANRLASYFGGELRALDDVGVACGGSPFQRDVWTALRKIPVGSTLSYGDLAKAIGRPAAVRAVGAANGANPIAIIVPCHRVIGANGTLTGYGGGIDRKRWLLTHEGALLV
jgi:methylated-DNA-[protein]-cysteine S-methyltransferase